MPEVSVIMGVNNGGRFITESLDSLRMQTFPDWELVLVDNGSTDGAVEAELKRKPDARVRVFKYPQPLTPGGAMVVACGEARGRFLAVLDHDDLATPTRLALQVHYLSAQPDVMLLGGASEVMDVEGRTLGMEPFVGMHEDIFALTPYVHVLRHSGIMFRRELLAKVPYRPVLGIASDFDFIARAAEVGRVAAVPAVTCRYRLHAHNRSSLQVGSAVKGGLTRMLTRRRRLGLSEDLEHWNDRFAAGVQTGDPIAAHLHCARIFEQAGQDDLAALHAWLALRAGGGIGAALRYAGAVCNGISRRPAMMSALVKAWMKEPVHQLLRAGGAPDRPQF
jgi:glycosyltransferase involved in cell wall biosynthesis